MSGVHNELMFLTIHFFFNSSNPLLYNFISSSLYKAPWARVMVYGQGHKVRRNGQLNLMEAVCYPLDASPTNTGLTPPPITNQYPSVIIPTDKVHIKLGEYLAHKSKLLQAARLQCCCFLIVC